MSQPEKSYLYVSDLYIELGLEFVWLFLIFRI